MKRGGVVCCVLLCLCLPLHRQRQAPSCASPAKQQSSFRRPGLEGILFLDRPWLVITDPVGEFVARSTYRNFFFCSSFARTIFRLAEDGSSCQSKADKAGLQSIINRGAKVLQPAVAGFGRPRLARYFRFSDRSVANLMFHLSSWGPVRTQTQTDVGTCGSRSFSNPRIPSSMHRRLPHHDDDARHLNLPGPCARSCDRPCQRPANMLAGPTSSQ